MVVLRRCIGSNFICKWLDCDCRFIMFIGIALVLLVSQQLLDVDAANAGDRKKKTAKLPTCQPNNFHYTYTECGDAGVRWRVQVPEPDSCNGGAPEPPIRAVDCGFSCGEGQYLDRAESQECKQCPPGTYSLGGGERFEDWTTLPEGFTTDSNEKGDIYYDASCANNSLWIPKGSYIQSPNNLCSSKLLFSANLKKAGSVSYTYTIPTSDTMLHVQVHNDQCEALSGSQDRWPTSTGEGQWKTEYMELKSGLNIISWISIGMSLESSQSPPPVLIKSVEIMGLSYTSECTKCRPGTFAKDEGSTECKLCPANTFSVEGANICSNCNQQTTYSNPGASKCINREPCKDSDYYMTHTPCDSKNQTEKTYIWIEPRICRVDIKGAAQLPKNGQVESCPPCNPGMSTFNQTICDYCPKNQYSDGTAVCKQCPPSTAPVYGMDFKWWNQMPPNMDSSCLSFSGYGCSEESGWKLAGDNIHSILGQADDAYLLLQVTVDGFDSEEGYMDGKAVEIGELSFVFGLECTGDCGMFLLEEHGPGSTKSTPVIETWEGSQEKQEYRYSITRNGPRTFTWAFQKADIVDEYSDDDSVNYRTDLARIYSIKITNAINGGAAMCKKCPRGSNLKGCIPCKPGMYIANNTENTCTKCPANTYLRANNPYGKESCLHCGPNLISTTDKTQCYSTCHVHANGRHYQLTELQGFHTLHTGASFTAKGSRYYHSFNFTLCGNEGDGQATCPNNVSHYSEGRPTDFENDEDFAPPVKSHVCQSTMIPSPSGGTISAQPMSLGDTLLGTTTAVSYGKLNATQFKPGHLELPDLHFYFQSGSVTKACPNGRSTIIYLRCDPSQHHNGTFKLPEECPAGTCDGCSFHILWLTEHGCPVCTSQDYTEIKEQCNKNGQQKIHYVWKTPRKCTYGVQLPEETKGVCPVIPWWAQVPMYAQIAIAVFVSCVVLMIALTVYFWKRNRKLEYKYQKLVAGANGELPAAETCAITEGDEEDNVIFEDGKNNGRSLFSKFKRKPVDMDMDKTGLLLSDDDEFKEAIELSPTRIQPLTNI